MGRARESARFGVGGGAAARLRERGERRREGTTLKWLTKTGRAAVDHWSQKRHCTERFCVRITATHSPTANQLVDGDHSTVRRLSLRPRTAYVIMCMDYGLTCFLRLRTTFPHRTSGPRVD